MLSKHDPKRRMQRWLLNFFCSAVRSIRAYFFRCSTLYTIFDAKYSHEEGGMKEMVLMH
jgi:hypothetical protein